MRRPAPLDQPVKARTGVIGVGILVALGGLVLMALAIHREGRWGDVSAALCLHALGWGGLAAAARAVWQPVALFRHSLVADHVSTGMLLVPGVALWILGWLGIALGWRRPVAEEVAPSESAGAPLYPRLASYRDFTWSTLFAYGGGILLAELVLIGLQTVLAGGELENGGLLPAVVAFGISALCAAAVAFGAGFLGAARAKRLAAPEATLGLIYFGLPIPLVLSMIPHSAWLAIHLGYRLREVLYVASLLGRPELGFWLVFFGLVLVMVLGITAGFVVTGSGRTDLRMGFELFVARRHVSIFRPSLVFGVFTVLLFGIIPPLILFAILRAAEAAVEKTRIRKLGEKDPMRAAEALHQAKARQQTPTEMMTALSVGGVGVGVMALIIVLSVMSGFEVDLQKKIIGSNAQAVVLKYGGPIKDWPKVMKKVGTVKDVTGQTPFIMNQVMLASDQNIDGVIIKGIDPTTVGKVVDIPKDVLPGGSVTNLTHPEKIKIPAPDPGALGQPQPAFPGSTLSPVGADDAADSSADPMIIQPKAAKPAVLPGILIGKELAATLKVRVGDRLNVVSPLGGVLGPQGPTPKSRPFRVAGIFYTGMYQYDSKFAYIDLKEAESFFDQDGVTGIELKVRDVDEARQVSRKVLEKLDGYPFQTKDWGEMNRNLFSALRLEKLVMGIILSLIVVVAAGLIVATVIMLVLEKRKEIAVLKALGASDGGIVKTFLAEGLQIGIVGGLIGLVSGLAWCAFIAKVGIKLDPEVYYIPSLPVKVQPLQTAVVVVIAVLVTYLASVYPALKAAGVEPVEGLKAE